ncbi:MAG: hypothetical protein ACJ790_06060 [Myxococcaceae bacterium]
MLRASFIAALLSLLAASACNKPQTADHPVDAYIAFTKLAERDPKAGYEALSKSTRDLLAAKSKELSAASGGSIVDDPAMIFFARPGKAKPVEDVKVVEEKGDVATLEVKSGGQVEQVRMVREDAKWRVDLADRVGAATKNEVKAQ